MDVGVLWGCVGKGGMVCSRAWGLLMEDSEYEWVICDFKPFIAIGEVMLLDMVTEVELVTEHTNVRGAATGRSC